MRRAGSIVLLTLTLGCDQGLREEVAVLREEAARHEATLDMLHRRIEELSAELEKERSERREGDAAREVLPPLPRAPQTDTPAIVPQCEGGQCTIARGELEALLTDPSQIIRSVRVIPAFRDGKPLGYKLFAIRPGSLFAAIGLQNGDTVQVLAGVTLVDMESALAAVAAAKTAERVTIKGLRKDQPLEVVVGIRADAQPAP